MFNDLKSNDIFGNDLRLRNKIKKKYYAGSLYRSRLPHRYRKK